MTAITKNMTLGQGCLKLSYIQEEDKKESTQYKKVGSM